MTLMEFTSQAGFVAYVDLIGIIGIVFFAGVFYQRVRDLEIKVRNFADDLEQGMDKLTAHLDTALSELRKIDPLTMQISDLRVEVMRMRDRFDQMADAART